MPPAIYGWNASALLILLPSFPLMANTGPGCFVFHFPAVIQAGTRLLKFNRSTGSFGRRYASVRWVRASRCTRRWEAETACGQVILILWAIHSHLPKINVQTDKQMYPSAPILFCQLGPYHGFSGGKNSNIPENWVISTFSAYSKYHQQTSNPIPFFLHYRKFLSLHKLVCVQRMNGPQKITFNLENSEQINWPREQTHAHVWFKTKALL